MAQVSCPTCQPAAGDWAVEKAVTLYVWVCGGEEGGFGERTRVQACQAQTSALLGWLHYTAYPAIRKHN